MATTTSKLLHIHPKLKPFPHPKPKFFSSNPYNENPPPPPPPPHSDPHPTPTPTPTPTHKPFSFSSIANNPSPKASSFDEIRKNLAEFRLRAAGSSSSSPLPSPPSLKELYEKNIHLRKPTPTTGKVDFSGIGETLRNLKENNNNNRRNESGGKGIDPLSLSRLQDSFNLRPNMGKDVKRSGFVIGGSGGSERIGNLPASIFGKEMMMRGKGGGGSGDKEGMRTEFVRTYNYGELGEKLRMLRPSKKEEKGWFSLNELKDRMMKVRESDEKDGKSIMGGSIFHDIRQSLEKLNDKSKKTIQSLDVLGQLGGTPTFMLHPPKEHLVEKFFHPDNMSSAEKMKLELQKVRDEFKMSESDCGSSRVQGNTQMELKPSSNICAALCCSDSSKMSMDACRIRQKKCIFGESDTVAQLTTKIKHLSSVLHKKDKHSRKGLQEMVQKRKKLLKYLRRTDWDSYCLVLSKLGLRDNPDYKF